MSNENTVKHVRIDMLDIENSLNEKLQPLLNDKWKVVGFMPAIDREEKNHPYFIVYVSKEETKQEFFTHELIKNIDLHSEKLTGLNVVAQSISKEVKLQCDKIRLGLVGIMVFLAMNNLILLAILYNLVKS